MKVTGMRLFPLRIPFRDGFNHAGKQRTHSDSIVVKLFARNGATGYGEAVARPYVTGESVVSCLSRITQILWPAVRDRNFSDLEIDNGPLHALQEIHAVLPPAQGNEVVAWHGAQAAFETALIDMLLRSQDSTMAELLRPCRRAVTYSAVVGLDGTDRTRHVVSRYRREGFKHYKLKIGATDPAARIDQMRKLVGSDADLRLDANCAFRPQAAETLLCSLDPASVSSVEQPIPRDQGEQLSRLQRSTKIPLMADESVVTLRDARRLIELGGCRSLNLRIAKCGGVYNVLKMADMADRAGLRYQIGCQVGETAILSAVGRHVAAHLPQVEFVEGSFGEHLLERDVAKSPVVFGRGGKAGLLQGRGLGIEVDDQILGDYATQSLTFGEV